MSVIQPQKMQWVDTSAIGRSRYLSFAVRNVLAIKWLPSGKLLHNYGKIHHFVGKSTISMTIFNSKLVVYQRVNLHFPMGFPMVFPWFSHGLPSTVLENFEMCKLDEWGSLVGRGVLRCCLLMGVTAGASQKSWSVDPDVYVWYELIWLWINTY